MTEQIVGDGFYLRRWNIEDAAWYVSARDEEIFRWTTEKRDLTIPETEEAIREANASTNALCYAIVDRLTQSLLGNIALLFTGSNPKTAEIMYWLAPSARGRGIATMATVLLCDIAFGSLGCNRITLKTLRDNHRSQQVALRAGFRLVSEGTEGENPDYLLFAKSTGR